MLYKFDGLEQGSRGANLLAGMDLLMFPVDFTEIDWVHVATGCKLSNLSKLRTIKNNDISIELVFHGVEDKVEFGDSCTISEVIPIGWQATLGYFLSKKYAKRDYELCKASVIQIRRTEHRNDVFIFTTTCPSERYLRKLLRKLSRRLDQNEIARAITATDEFRIGFGLG